MNAWYFSFEFPPEFGGGLSTYMGVVAEAYGRRGDGFLVIFTLSAEQSGLISSRYLHTNVLLITLNPLRSLESEKLGWWVNVSRMFERFGDLLVAQIMSGLVDIPSPDYIEFADGFGIGTITVQQKLCGNLRLGDVPIIVNAHTPTYIIDRMSEIPAYRLPGYWTGKMELQALAGADLVIGPSEAILRVVEDELSLSGARLPRTKVLHNPYFVDWVEQSSACAEPDHVYMASRLAHWKGPEDAIRAMEVLWLSGIEIPFLIYGEDTFYEPAGSMYSAYLEKKYQRWFESGLIQLMGKVPRAQIRERAESAYAQLHPSHFDNFPFSVVEAMSEGRVCVAGLNGGIREIAADGQGLFLADVGEPEAFAAVIKRAIDMSPADRVSFAHLARQTIRQACDPIRYLARKEELVADVHSAVAEVSGIEKQPPQRDFPFLSPAHSSCVFAASEPGNGPELSVVIPYYNMGAFVDEAIASVTSCTTKDVEIIVVNDGSTQQASLDRLEHLHATHKLDDGRLRILNIANGGVANARNTGVRAARAPFVTLLDADDMVSSRYYEKALRILRMYRNVSFVGAWIEDYNQFGRIRNWATWNAEPPIQLVMNQTNCQSLVYKRQAFLSDGEHDPALRMFLDDWEGVIALLASGHRGVMIPEPLFQYRIRSGSIFRSQNGLWDLNVEKIIEKHRDLYGEWGAEVAAFLNANGPSSCYHVAGKASALRR